MASTVAGDTLTEQFRKNSIRTQAYTLQGLRAINNRYLLEAVYRDNRELYLAPFLLFQNRISTLYTDNTIDYLKAFRIAEEVPGTAPRPPSWKFNSNRAAGSAMATGFNLLKEAMVALGVNNVYNLPTETQKRAMSNAENWAVREVFRNSRNTIVSYSKSDSRAIGYARTTDGDPCKFCAMLATRGPIYAQDTVGFASHSKCGCSGEPVYDNWSYTPQTEDLAQQWMDNYRIRQNEKMIRELNKTKDPDKEYIDWLKKNSQEISEGKKGGYLYGDGIGSDLARPSTKKDETVFKNQIGRDYKDFIEEQKKEWEAHTDAVFPKQDPEELKLLNDYWINKRDEEKKEGKTMSLSKIVFS